MAQFDVHLIAGHGYVVDCQSDLLNDLRSRVVAPLRDPDEPTVWQSRLNPEVTIDGTRYRVAAQFLRSVDRRQLGRPVASLAAHEWDIKAALDMLISGY
ncbi:Toxin CcdB [Sphingomonas sp. EC-HK361]|uniref:CcdB family protein n=1 Tax=Sphingomonas sp. EC-HK361 TaxID=2038397 RepID=UPI001252BC36|nr:CcdB family protein [Sphingomonas sp. EC-HK361]VVS96128.1 Toxin CcdB [Sphingomonas sp. EC-HK361]